MQLENKGTDPSDYTDYYRHGNFTIVAQIDHFYVEKGIKLGSLAFKRTFKAHDTPIFFRIYNAELSGLEHVHIKKDI